MIIDRVKKTIGEHQLLEKGDHVVLGLSGGPDSLCLFFLLDWLREEWALTLHVVHVNHRLRPGAAEEDQQFVEDLCRQKGVFCHVVCCEVEKKAKEKGISSEEMGREVRYAAFFAEAEKIRKQTGGIVKIAVAQHLNDQAETVLMRIMRGTGTDGLSGIAHKRKGQDGTEIIRPLLEVSREEIEQFCMEHQLQPQMDLTNLEPVYTRNKVRLELIPYIESNFNPNLVLALHRLAKIASDDRDFFHQQVEQLISAHGVIEESGGSPQFTFPLAVVQSLHPALRRRLILQGFSQIGLVRNVSAVHLEQAETLFTTGKAHKTAEFPSGYLMKISDEQVFFLKPMAPRSLQLFRPLDLDDRQEIPELAGEIRVDILRREEWEKKKSLQDVKSENFFHCSLDLDEIEKQKGKLILRTRRQGDYLWPLGMKGRKKLQDFFVDAKVKRERRDQTPLICIGSEVIWVVGYRISERYKIQSHTKRIIWLEVFLKK